MDGRGAAFLENNGVVLVLFETPSGFAIFGFCGLHLYAPDALESVWLNFTSDSMARDAVWLKDFLPLDDKSNAINDKTGVNGQLAEMIMKCRRPGQELVVGKAEYKSIEIYLGIPCLHNEIVMELMWGMKRFMHALVPREKLELPKEDRLLMSRGLHILLSRHGFDDVKPEMVNEQILRAASSLFICDAVEQQHHEIGHSDKEVLPEDVTTKLLADADKYDDKINKLTCRTAHKKSLSNYRTRDRHINMLSALVRKARQAGKK
ncbi:hypothetical protein BS78_02G182900 [Paspalum vaginatum]|nr:hypothetical protein BS78_02G182900 [Paspalum vaginatum]